MNRRAFIKTAKVLSAVGAISADAQAPKYDAKALKQFQELLRYPDEQFDSFLQNPPEQTLLRQVGEIAKRNILFEVLKKTL